MSSGDFYEKSKVNTVSIMERLFQTKARTADVHFVFEVNGVPTHRISAHRNVLAMGSPIFDEMFFGPDKHFIEGDIPTRSSTITSYTFEAFIALFYGKQIINRFNLYLMNQKIV